MSLLTIDQLLSLSAEETLKVVHYFDMFPNSEDGVDRVHKKLRSKWHPDKGGDKTVFGHIEALAGKARDQISAGVWGKYKRINFETRDSTISMSYLRQDTLPGVASQYTGRRIVGYEIQRDNLDLVDIWVANLAKLRSKPNKEMLEDGHLHAATQLEWVRSGPLLNSDSVLVFHKEPLVLCLQHVLDSKKTLPPEHVAWILTRLYNLCCLMHIAGTPNLDISPQSIFIVPASHSVVLFEGWQYVSGFGKKPKALPSRTARLCPSIQSLGSVEISHCLSLVKAVGRECLGDPFGARMLSNPVVHKRLAKWLISPAGSDSVEELQKWKKVRDEVFGPPKWQELKLTEDDVY